MLRAAVSKKKFRFQEDGFDLDLTYVLPNVIAMGAPAEGTEAAFRNPLTEVQRFFETRHKDHYKLYDLRGEKGAAYDPAKFHGQVAKFGFFDHNPASLRIIRECVLDIDAWLKADPENVAAIHCKAGKGRTGLIIAAYLVYSRLAPSTTEALRYFGEARTSNGKGVTIPSQMRYVHYFEQSLLRDFPAATYRLRHIRLHGVPNFDPPLGGCDPYFEVRIGDGKALLFSWYKANKGRIRNYKPRHKIVDFEVWSHNVRVKGDVKMVFTDADLTSAHDKMFHLWFNTGFIDNNYLLFHKEVLDRACKDTSCKEFEPSFKVEIFLDRVDDVEGEFDHVATEYLDADNDDDMSEEDDESK